ncbi:STAS domain-containing protein [Streptomyces carminius]|uniref:STAS domain-containing protein n=1 Tax=Streptomyces carminius TaxID=2665496 RepID=UPI0013045989
MLVLDLAVVDLADSSALNALITVYNRAQAAGGRLALAAVPERLGRLLAITGTDTVLPAYPTAVDAIEAMAAADAGGSTTVDAPVTGASR